MPTRNQTIIRRDINRLKDTIERHKDNNPALSALLPIVESVCDSVNSAWNNYRSVAVQGDKERAERETAVDTIIKWIQRWRPVIILYVPGADKNIKILPAREIGRAHV